MRPKFEKQPDYNKEVKNNICSIYRDLLPDYCTSKLTVAIMATLKRRIGSNEDYYITLMKSKEDITNSIIGKKFYNEFSAVKYINTIVESKLEIL